MEISIGQLSSRTGVKVPTIRFYEQIGLLPVPSRTDGNQRRYGQAQVDRLNFIRNARGLGFEVEDIRELLDMAAEPQSSCHQADSIAKNHLREVEDRIVRLEALRAELARMIEECGHGRVCDCRIISVIANPEGGAEAHHHH